jgi:hypothetical protein
MRAAPPDNLLLFTPHTPRRAHATGWIPDRQRAFIAALARTGVVRAAAESVGMSARSAYQLRARVAAHANCLVDAPLPADAAAMLGPGYIFSFAAAWDLALQHGLGLQCEAALPLAFNGEPTPVIRRGRIIGWYDKFNSRLAINALGAWRRSRGGIGHDHEYRIADRNLHLVQALDALLRLGPVEWPDPPPPKSDFESGGAHDARMRKLARPTGVECAHGLLDPPGAAGGDPMRKLRSRPAPAPPDPRVRGL